ncbi:MAG TPA: hypothetical protein DHR80_10275 [Thalassospira lucentensis]|uniref:Uncharacterized protein n=1 Tax=Thalassospira lucentensis TaxID=168935 RepID=A0A3D5N928_9PROT|nr:hypothetical protein [Thalassospira lucentensis]HCW67570.1 hypothetical protein [Thalassospira lucentensis]|tara:strand:+ start:176 stop:1027 length:852 start_codon:yes stop_codon:yes gene_type:complete
MAIVTDPAMEIVELCKFFGSINPNKPNVPTHQVLAEHFSSDPRHAYLVLHNGRKRFFDFSESLRKIDDPLVDEAILTLAKNACQKFIKFTDLKSIHSPWGNHSKTMSDPQNWASVMAVSMVYRRDSPIKKLSEEEIEEIRSAISDDAIIDQVLRADAPDFLKDALRNTIQHLRVMLQYLPVFGLEQLAKIAQELDWKNRAVGVADPKFKESKPYKNMLSAAMIAISIYVVPAEVISATKEYRDVIGRIAAHVFDEEKKEKQEESRLLDNKQQLLDGSGRIGGP